MDFDKYLTAGETQVKFTDVCGYSEQKSVVMGVIMDTIHQAKMGCMMDWQNLGAKNAMQSILLYGPPGVGKTYFMKGIMSYFSKYYCRRIIAYEFNKMADAESYGYKGKDCLIEKFFEKIREAAPCILFIDDIENGCGFQNDQRCNKKAITELVEFLKCTNIPGCVIVLASTRPGDIHPSILDIVGTKIAIAMPDMDTRIRILKRRLKNGECETGLSDGDFEHIGRDTRDYSAADCISLSQDILMEPVRIIQKSRYFKVNDDGKYNVCGPEENGAEERDFMSFGVTELVVPEIDKSIVDKIMKQTTPSICKADLLLFKDFETEQGILGGAWD